MAVDYQHCYEKLEIMSPTNWTDLNTHYRKLVQTWHPDRYAGPNPDVAEKKFIELTKAFGVLREYHRAHDKLPDVAIRSKGTHREDHHRAPMNRQEVFGDSSVKHRKQSPFKTTQFARRALLQGGCFLIVGIALLVLFWSMENRNKERLVDRSHIVKSSTADRSITKERPFKPYSAVLPAPPKQSNDL